MWLTVGAGTERETFAQNMGLLFPMLNCPVAQSQTKGKL